jgi:general secretion pathway protein K
MKRFYSAGRYLSPPALCKDSKAMILVVSLWILTILAVLAVGLGYRSSLELKLADYNLDKLKTLYIAEAALQRAMAELEKDRNNYDALNETWSNGRDAENGVYIFKDVEVGDGVFNIGYIFSENDAGEAIKFYGMMDEERKININTAPLEMLLSLPGLNEEIAAAIIDWRDADDKVYKEGAENDYYQGLEKPYECKNGPFQVLEELLLVKGITPESFAKFKDIVTIYGSGKININTASREVLEVLGRTCIYKGLPGVDDSEMEDLVNKIIRFRIGDDESAGTEDDNIFISPGNIVNELQDAFGELSPGQKNALNYLLPYLTVSSEFYSLNIAARSEDKKVSKKIYAVTDRDSGIKYWHEEQP